MIIGTGVDIVEIVRFRKVMERLKDRFLLRVFTPGEQQFCIQHRDPVPHFAVRFAAKEALFKALGTGWAKGVTWLDVEVQRERQDAPKIIVWRSPETQQRIRSAKGHLQSLLTPTTGPLRWSFWSNAFQMQGGAMLCRLLIFACWLGCSFYWKLRAKTVKPAAQAQSAKSRLARFPVWLGYLLLLMAGVCPSLSALRGADSAAAAWLGVALCASGLVFGIWSRRTLGDDWSRDVELKQGHRLVLQGPYSLVRHPIYTAHLLMALGSAVSFGTWLGYAAVASFFVGFRVKLAQEEELLSRSFPNEYPEYKARVKALVPWVL